MVAMEIEMIMNPAKSEVTFNEFEKLDIRVGTIINAEPNVKARKAAFVLRIDFGPLGILDSSAQITENYSAEALIGRQVVAVVNFPPKLVAGVKSRCLVLGALSPSIGVVCLTTTHSVENGSFIA